MQQPRTRILKCAVCAAPPVHPGFAASWGLGCQDISLEDNENICCFSSKTASNNRHRMSRAPDCRAAGEALPQLRGVWLQQLPEVGAGCPEPPLAAQSCLCLPTWADVSRESALGAAEWAAPPQPEDAKITPATPHGAGCPALHWISRSGFKITSRSSSKTRMRELRPLPSTSQ